MKFLIIDRYYPEFLKFHYSRDRGLRHRPYEVQMAALMQQAFGTADFYSRNLRALGYEADELIVNAGPLQRAWAKEHAPELLKRSRIPEKAWEMKVVEQQILQFRPEVLYFQDPTYFDFEFISHLRSVVRLVVGQCASPLDWSFDFSCYDLILTSFPHYVRILRDRGVPSAYLRLAFEPSVLERLGDELRSRKLVFIGGLSNVHRTSLSVLEKAAKELPIDFFGYGVDELPAGSQILARYRGKAWGIEMYRQLARSNISLNRHIDVSGRFANNMRLYETTGVGTCLVTDLKDNLSELFSIDEEVVTYQSTEECVEKIKYLLSHDEERVQIARAGQKRTLSEHTYSHRMEEIVELVAHIPSSSERSHTRVSEWTTQRLSSGEAIKELVRQSPLAPLARGIYRLGRRGHKGAISAGHALLDAESQIAKELRDGWKSPAIPPRQRYVVDQELARMYKGDVVPIFRVAAQAIAATGLLRPLVLDVGCASGYYHEVLNHLVSNGVKYLGTDYSPSLVSEAARVYPGVQFFTADAAALPMRDASVDIVFSSGVLMHIAEYEAAILESFRLSSAWCVFHRTPVFEVSRTTHLSKEAYGVPVMEIVFNEVDLIDVFTKAGGRVTETLVMDDYSVPGLNEKVRLKTYVCARF